MDRSYIEDDPSPSSSPSRPPTGNWGASTTDGGSNPTRSGIVPIHNPFAAVTPTGATRLGDPPSPWFYEARGTNGGSDTVDADAQARREARQARHQRTKNDKTAKDARKEKKAAKDQDDTETGIEVTEIIGTTSRGDAVSGSGGGGLLDRMAMRLRPSFGNLWESAKDHKEKRTEKDQGKK